MTPSFKIQDIARETCSLQDLLGVAVGCYYFAVEDSSQLSRPLMLFHCFFVGGGGGVSWYTIKGGLKAAKADT
jgi:hypothetical protein